MTEKTSTNIFDLLVSIRGGLPEKCDFCGLPYIDGRYPVPEEAGAWSCSECEAEDIAHTKHKTR
jgi:hypothetical protein